MKVEFHSGKTLELTPADLDDLQRRLDRFKRAPIGLIPGSELELFLVKIWLKKLQIERT